MPIGIALIGSGIFAKEEHLPAIQATPLLSLNAIYSRSLRSAKTLSENLADVELYSDDSDGKSFEDLLKRDDIKGVVIA
jgi:predicted dehydrogenase